MFFSAMAQQRESISFLCAGMSPSEASKAAPSASGDACYDENALCTLLAIQVINIIHCGVAPLIGFQLKKQAWACIAAYKIKGLNVSVRRNKCFGPNNLTSLIDCETSET